MATCVRCDEKFRLGATETCGRAPDRGAHEAQPHPFTPTRLDGLCGYVDPDFPGNSCGFRVTP